MIHLSALSLKPPWNCVAMRLQKPSRQGAASRGALLSGVFRHGEASGEVFCAEHMIARGAVYFISRGD